MATQQEMELALAAIEHGYASREQVQQCLDIQRNTGERDERSSLLEIMQRKKYLSKTQVQLTCYHYAAAEGMEPESEELIQGYQILDKGVKGGMATVFLARWQDYDCPVALKVLHPKYRRHVRMVKSFLNEARLLCRLDCKNIAKGYQYGKSRSLYFVAMEFVDGVSLQTLIEKYGGLGETLSLHIVLQIAGVLSYLESGKIVHRDIKPGNVLINGKGHCTLCDLGFAKRTNKKDYLQKKGVTCGTAAYLSPEQAMGEEDLDIRSDLYSLGATLYHLILGDVPFRGSQSEIIAQQVTSRLDKSVKNKMSSSCYSVICKMMAKDRNARYQNADELILAIKKILRKTGKDEFEFSHDLPFDFSRLCRPEAIPENEIYQTLRVHQARGKFKRTVGLKKIPKHRK